MSQSQTFNLIHKCYQYIISSNKELLTEILLKMALNTINSTKLNVSCCVYLYRFSLFLGFFAQVVVYLTTIRPRSR
jgi:hypothetical protein